MSDKVQFIAPISVTSSMVTSTTLFDPTYVPTTYSSGTAYAVGNYANVVGPLGEQVIYKSLQNSNLNHTPDSSPTWWEYNSTTYLGWVFTARGGRTSPYGLGYKVYDPLYAYVYESLTADNTAVLDPINEPIWANIGTITSPVVPPDYSSTTTYAADVLVVGGQSITTGELVHRVVYKSLAGSNTNNAPPASPTWWEIVPNYPLPWIFTGNYDAGDVAYKTDNTLWKSLGSNNQNNTPGTTISTWLKLQPVNITAMFDDTTLTGTVANKLLNVTVPSGIITGVGLIGVDADSATLTVRDGLNGTIVYQQTLGLTGGNPTNGWDYYFSDPSIRKTQAYFSGIPPYLNSYVTLDLSGIGMIGLGNFILGTAKELGYPEYGLSSEIIDYSKKTTDDFGKTTFVRRGFKRTIDTSMFIAKADLPRIEAMLENVRATPILVIASEDPDYSETAIRYCFYKSFRTEIKYHDYSFCSIQFEGLI